VLRKLVIQLAKLEVSSRIAHSSSLVPRGVASLKDVAPRMKTMAFGRMDLRHGHS
jgi:hypothetical protein